MSKGFSALLAQNTQESKKYYAIFIPSQICEVDTQGNERIRMIPMGFLTMNGLDPDNNLPTTNEIISIMPRDEIARHGADAVSKGIIDSIEDFRRAMEMTLSLPELLRLNPVSKKYWEKHSDVND